jgi:small subunit ribosomal protein S9
MAANSDRYFYALGRRKSATARVRLQGGKGVITVNGKPAAEYFADSSFLLSKLEEPFSALGQENKYDISAVVSGGGHDGQIEAIRLGIAKSLTMIDENLKATLRRANLLSRDPRDKERKKFGLKGARKQRQFTKR